MPVFSNEWTISEVNGHLFDTQGKISDHIFWASRFYIGPRENNISFIRIPVGMRTLLEHMATTVDFFRILLHENIIDSEKFINEIKDPESLHYNCLTHWISILLSKTYGSNKNAFVVAGQLVSLICEIPFDDPSIWNSLRIYAEKNYPELAPLMIHPHPSFLFPIIKLAAFKTDIDWNSNDLSNTEEIIGKILHQLYLPPLKELKEFTYAKSQEVIKILDNNSISHRISELITAIQETDKEIGFNRKFFITDLFPSGTFPIPILFKDGRYIEGDIIDLELSNELLKASRRRDEMLRYNYSRNIVS